MVGMCWFMYTIMHANASGLLGMFQAEIPKIALPMRIRWLSEAGGGNFHRGRSTGRTGRRVRVNGPDANKLGQRIVRNLDT